MKLQLDGWRKKWLQRIQVQPHSLLTESAHNTSLFLSSTPLFYFIEGPFEHFLFLQKICNAKFHFLKGDEKQRKEKKIKNNNNWKKKDFHSQSNQTDLISHFSLLHSPRDEASRDNHQNGTVSARERRRRRRWERRGRRRRRRRRRRRSWRWRRWRGTEAQVPENGRKHPFAACEWRRVVHRRRGADDRSRHSRRHRSHPRFSRESGQSTSAICLLRNSA